jgi:hypothetical protein
MRTNSKLPLVGRLNTFMTTSGVKNFGPVVYPCIECRNRSGLLKIFDIDAFLWIKGFSFIRLAPDQLQASLELKRFVCPNCGSIYSFEGDEYSRFLWLLNRY